VVSSPNAPKEEFRKNLDRLENLEVICTLIVADCQSPKKVQRRWQLFSRIETQN
jgi:hypothetical protein